MSMFMKIVTVIITLGVLYYLSPIFSNQGGATVDMRVLCLFFTAIGLNVFFTQSIRFVTNNLKVKSNEIDKS
ncbi:hypothetical protein DEU50_12258 [Aeromonas salmonicida]|uniref:Uncharacterized protein n=1 Tax=Aeromonas salmonicida TaxID=645 RepID=A0AAX1PF64_AERSA|nr:hypothetical protein DEU50_12258 [Aeromonas salmonicida]